MKGLVLPALLIVLAEIGARLHGPSDVIAPPSQVIVAFGEAIRNGSLILATRDTLIAAFGGLTVGAIIGLALGVVLGLSRTLDRVLELPVEVLRPIPSVAVIPVALIVLGFGYGLEIAIVAFACVWPMLIFARAAVAGVEPRLLEVARALKLSPWATVAKIVAPAALMMDEPFGALDAMTRQDLQDQMLEIARATGATILFVTHDLEEAIYLGDRVIGLKPHPGRIGVEIKVDLPRPRDQVATRESPAFLALRRQLYDFIHGVEGKTK